MNILWITNITFQQPAMQLGLPATFTEGWLSGLAYNLCKSRDIHLSVVSFAAVSSLSHVSDQGIDFYVLPAPGKDGYFSEATGKLWQQVIERVRPDAVHINGTEFQYGLSMMHFYPDFKYIVSIQGLVSICKRYFFTGIPVGEILKDPRTLVMSYFFQNKFDKRSVTELKYLRSAHHVIGRTDWDRTHTSFINPALDYHFCNETLRASFYQNRWDIAKAEPHRIFMAQATYPIKGLHIALRAVRLLADRYPDVKLYVAGVDRSYPSNIVEKIGMKMFSYHTYIKRLIKRYGLEGNVVYTGALNEQQMVEQYCRARVFISPSTIENSPNSVGEAQLLGTPVVASYVGGVGNMVSHGQTGLLYRVDEQEMLAKAVMDIFESDRLALELSENARPVAMRRHDPQANVDTIVDIYKKVVQKA